MISDGAPDASRRDSCQLTAHDGRVAGLPLRRE